MNVSHPTARLEHISSLYFSYQKLPATPQQLKHRAASGDAASGVAQSPDDAANAAITNVPFSAPASSSASAPVLAPPSSTSNVGAGVPAGVDKSGALVHDTSHVTVAEAGAFLLEESGMEDNLAPPPSAFVADMLTQEELEAQISTLADAVRSGDLPGE